MNEGIKNEWEQLQNQPYRAPSSEECKQITELTNKNLTLKESLSQKYQRISALAACNLEIINKLDAERVARKQAEGALRGIIEIGKRDMSNPKYDDHFNYAEAVLSEIDKRGKT